MIHPQAIVDSKAELAPDVEVGPWSFIGPGVQIDSGTVIGPHTVIKGPTQIGKNNKIFQFSSIGEDCQDKKYAGEPTRLEIGDDNVIREYVTIHRGTVQDQGVTSIGNDNLLMAYVHIGHDCIVGNHVVLANYSALAGHVIVGDYVILGGMTGVHQFCSVGAYSMSSISSVIVNDVPAFLMVQGNNATARGMNFEGMRRKGFAAEDIQALRQAYKTVYRKGLTVKQALSEIESSKDIGERLQLFIDSIKSSKRGIVR
ncbi:MAG: acyl-[acyl-carrier-protein]--UDP-N-acetylglucosamine O-acyltransferase [Gammaproteobacteria bacterium]|nr:MAG: acyl-[acyl-carrier-protein]--UDP-N-acetylglucosamine O-acyltransferase [Gammaproteobacteria bacterium]